MVKKTGGYVMDNYNENSIRQLRMLQNIIEDFNAALNHVKNKTNGCICIVDYGSSEGQNSMIFLKQTIENFRTENEHPVHVIHNDLPDNN